MIGIIGYGRFGRLAVQNLSADFDVAVYTRSASKKKDIAEAGGHMVSIEDACHQKLVVLCVPHLRHAGDPQTDRTAAQSGHHRHRRLLRKNQPHPMDARTAARYGGNTGHPPHVRTGQCGQNLCAGKKMVLCPERIDPKRYLKIKAWLEGKGLTLIETSADPARPPDRRKPGPDPISSDGPFRSSALFNWTLIPKATNGCCTFWRSSAMTPGNSLKI